MKIMICGKGGSGKSTVCALIASAMNKKGRNVLLLDADESNIGLYRMLGLEMPTPLMDSLGGKKGFREKTQTSGISLGGPPKIFPDKMTPENLPKACVAAKESIRIISLGKIHHFNEGCACPMGRLFGMFFSSLVINPEDLVIIDTAAGVEHFGRGLERNCDRIFCVVDPSYESVMMAGRVQKLAKEADLPISLILNKVTPEIEQALADEIDTDLIIGRVPSDQSIFMNTLKGQPLKADLPALDSICDAIENMQEE